MYQTKESLVNKKLSSDELAWCLDGWPYSNSRYSKQRNAYVPDVSKKLSSDEPTWCLDGWPYSNSKYSYRPNAYVPEERKLSK